MAAKTTTPRCSACGSKRSTPRLVVAERWVCERCLLELELGRSVELKRNGGVPAGEQLALISGTFAAERPSAEELYRRNRRGDAA